MIRSMTGFARSERSGPWGALTWELRTVNHRYLEVSLRLPEEMRSAEGELRQIIAGVLRRGKVDCTFNFKPTAIAGREMQIDRALVRSLLKRVGEVSAVASEVLVATQPVDPVELLRWPGVVLEPERDLVPLHSAAREALEEALTQLAAARAREGQRLAELIEQRCTTLVELADTVAARLPEVRARFRARLTEKLAQLTAAPDSDRLEQELLLLAQKMDVDEELDRLKGHIVEVRASLRSPEPAGRRLDFLMQELNREANTLSSKSQDLDTTRAAVEMKIAIDQMREQIQNVE